MSEKNFIRKDVSNVIKGVALILMFIHHFFTFPEWYISKVSYPSLISFAKYFNEPLKICVTIFAFLTGYFYYYTIKKNLKYSLKKSINVYVSYVITFIILLILALLLKTYDFSFHTFILELFLIRKSIMYFCWYVNFYIVAIFLLPLYSKLSNRSSTLSFFMLITITTSILMIISNFIPTRIHGFYLQMIEYLKLFFTVAIGYIFAEKQLFFELDSALKTKKTYLKIIIDIIIIIMASMARYYTQEYDFIYTPLFIYGVVDIISHIKKVQILIPFSILGKYSLIMWFIHGMFFNNCKEYTQTILYYPNNPLLVLLWGIILCLSISIPIYLLIDFVNKKINNYFFKRN